MEEMVIGNVDLEEDWDIGFKVGSGILDRLVWGGEVFEREDGWWWREGWDWG